MLLPAVLAALFLTADAGLSLEQMRRAAEAAFPAPDSRWEVIPQPFWKQHVVLKLVSSQWPHHPAVAVGPDGKAVVLSRVQHLADEEYIGRFNRISELEHVRISDENAPDYAGFFLVLLFDRPDRLCVVGPQPNCVAGRPGAFVVRRFAEGFHASTHLKEMEPDGETVFDLAVDAGGRIDFRRKWIPRKAGSVRLQVAREAA